MMNGGRVGAGTPPPIDTVTVRGCVSTTLLPAGEVVTVQRTPILRALIDAGFLEDITHAR